MERKERKETFLYIFMTATQGSEDQGRGTIHISVTLQKLPTVQSHHLFI